MTEPVLLDVIRQSLRADVSISKLVIAAAAAAEQIGDVEATKWLDEELHGYAFADRVPDYRKVSVDPVSKSILSDELTLLTWSENAREDDKAAVILLPAAKLERLLRKHRKDPYALYYGLRSVAIVDDTPLFELRRAVTGSDVKGVLDGVRQRIMMWAEKAAHRHVQEK